MPEYLAPDVYVEEVDTGSKPIEGVSTSVAGVVGVTERGPLNVPILVTSSGEYANWFGGVLTKDDFGPHRFLPHAVEGFFTNGGKQLYVTRVLDTALMASAESNLFDRTAPAPAANTVLLRAAVESTGTVANPPPLVVLHDANFAVNDWLRVGDGSNAEYRQVAIAPTAETVLVPLHLPLGHSHADGGVNNAVQFPRVAAGAAVGLVTDSGADALVLDIEGLTADVTNLDPATAPAGQKLIEIGGTNGEYRFVTAISSVTPTSGTNTRARITLDAPLAFEYAGATPGPAAIVQRITVGAAATASITPAVRAGDSLLFVNNRGGNFATRADLVLLDGATTVREVRRIGEMSQVQISPPAQELYPAGSLVDVVTLGDDSTARLTGPAAAGPTPKPVTDIRPFHVGQHILVGTSGNYERHVVATIVPGAAPAGTIATAAPLAANKAAPDIVVARYLLTADTRAGLTFLAIDDRSGLGVGDVVHVTDGALDEYVTIAAVPLPGAPGVW
ncbi:MAG TPA: hypothetical protein VKJ01_10270, partial [Candidatus Solibacter sp.]|nr:hypothetical protein [Candidatus Solibacter sp.]